MRTGLFREHREDRYGPIREEGGGLEDDGTGHTLPRVLQAAVVPGQSGSHLLSADRPVDFNFKTYDEFIEILEDRENIEYLLLKMEEVEAERTEARARGERAAPQ